MNNIFKHGTKIEIEKNFFLESDTFRGIVLVQHFPATKKNKEGVETQYIKEERFYFPTLAQALKKYTDLKQIILPTVEEMLEVQKQTLTILEQFKTNYQNW